MPIQCSWADLKVGQEDRSHPFFYEFFLNYFSRVLGKINNSYVAGKSHLLWEMYVKINFSFVWNNQVIQGYKSCLLPHFLVLTVKIGRMEKQESGIQKPEPEPETEPEPEPEPEPKK